MASEAQSNVPHQPLDQTAQLSTALPSIVDRRRRYKDVQPYRRPRKSNTIDYDGVQNMVNMRDYAGQTIGWINQAICKAQHFNKQFTSVNNDQQSINAHHQLQHHHRQQQQAPPVYPDYGYQLPACCVAALSAV